MVTTAAAVRVLVSPDAEMTSERQSVADRHHTRTWVRLLSRVVTSKSWSVEGSASEPVLSA